MPSFISLIAGSLQNMADKNIYFYPSKTPVVLEVEINRYYYSNCHGDKVDYSWFADNLYKAQGSPKSDDINAAMDL